MKYSVQEQRVSTLQEQLLKLIREWREFAEGHYCQTYNRGMAQGLNQAADSLEELLNDNIK